MNLTYLFKWRYEYFIDRRNHDLHTHQFLKKLDLKARELAIYGLRELVFKDKAMQDDLAKLLYNLVTKDKEVHELMLRLFVDLVRMEFLMKDTIKLTDDSLDGYLRSKLATD